MNTVMTQIPNQLKRILYKTLDDIPKTPCHCHRSWKLNSGFQKMGLSEV